MPVVTARSIGMTTIDLLFPVVGSRLPTDHCYMLYGAMSRLLPCLHDGNVAFAMAPITGQYVGHGLLQLDPMRSRLRLRLSAADVPRVLPLAGKGITVMRHRIRLGVPQIQTLEPAPALYARTVAIKNSTEVGTFLQTARRQLDEIGVGGSLRVPEHIGRNGSVEPQRRVLRIKGVRIVGFALLVEELTPEESLRLQELGLGGRRRVGCGVFVPAGGEEHAR
jgi:CRISPR-associated protein Cas6